MNENKTNINWLIGNYATYFESPIKYIFQSLELDESSVVKNYLTTANDNKL